MCRSINNHGISVACKQTERLTITAFCLRLSASNYQTVPPETLTLLYLPRISCGTLEINDAKIRHSSAALVELHRARSEEMRQGLCEGDPAEAAFRSTVRVRLGDGVRFEVFVKDEKVVKGVFRRDEEEEKAAWKVECQCVPTDGRLGVSAAEICVSGESCGVLRTRVEMRVRKKRWAFSGLEEIPEGSESETDGCDCDEEMDMGSSTADGWDEVDEVGREDRMSEMEMEMEMEGVRWAVDLGIWVVCLGVGILVSRASPRRLMSSRARKFV